MYRRVLSPHVSPQCVFRPGGEEEDGPFVWTERELRVRVRCRVRRVEMLGVTDGRSLKALVAQLNPLKLALVGGGAAEAAELRSHVEAAAESRARPTKVFVPADGEQVNGSSETALFRSEKLTPPLLLPPSSHPTPETPHP